MANVVSVNVDEAVVASVFAEGTRSVASWRAADAPSILDRAANVVPDLVLLGGDAAFAADIAQTLADDPVLAGTPLVAWAVHGSLAHTSRLVALGVRVVTGDRAALRKACEETLDAREGRTIRVDPAEDAPAKDPDAPDLHGRRVLVADDDPAIAWYFGDLLRAEGCDVEEVSDGEAALDRARRTMPDLIFSDIRMPRMDGLRLCRALRADPVLADVPVVLLSWKDDWLAQAEEEGVEASAFLPKRSTPEQVRSRVLELLGPHTRLERRMSEAGTLRGRLEGLAPYRLLRLACALRPDSRLTVRAPGHAHEVQMRQGAPRSATCADPDGSVLRGSPALAALLAERSGRFSLRVEKSQTEGDLAGTLYQQVASCVARARGAPSKAKLPVRPAPRAAPPSERASREATGERVQAETLAGPLARTAPIAPRPYVAQGVAPPRPAGEATRPLSTPTDRTAPTAAAARPIRTARSRTSFPPPSRKGPLKWVGVAAIAVLGVVLGAGVRAMHQPSGTSPAAPIAAAAQP